MLQAKNISRKETTGDALQVTIQEVGLHLRDYELTTIPGPVGLGRAVLFYITSGLIPAKKDPLWRFGQNRRNQYLMGGKIDLC